MEGSAPGHRLAKLWRMAGGIWTAARRLRPRRTVAALVRSYGENDLLTYASAISFRVFFALIPLGLFALGVLGFLHLDEVWRQDIAPGLRPSVSRAAFTVMEGTVKEVLGQRQLFWITFGAAIAIWQISGAMRAIMRVFNAIYGVEDRRSFWRRILVSWTLATVVGVLVLVAVVLARFGGAAVQAALGGSPFVAVIAFALRWGVAIALATAVPTCAATAAPAAPDTGGEAGAAADGAGRAPRGPPGRTYRTSGRAGAPGARAGLLGAQSGYIRATNLKGRFAAHAHHPPHRGRAAPPVWRLRLQPSRATRLVAPPFPGLPVGRPGPTGHGTVVASGVDPDGPTWRTPSLRPFSARAAPPASAGPRRERLAAPGWTVYALAS